LCSGVTSQKLTGEAKMFDFRRATYIVWDAASQKMTRYSKNSGGRGPLASPIAFCCGAGVNDGAKLWAKTAPNSNKARGRTFQVPLVKFMIAPSAASETSSRLLLVSCSSDTYRRDTSGCHSNAAPVASGSSGGTVSVVSEAGPGQAKARISFEEVAQQNHGACNQRHAHLRCGAYVASYRGL